MAQRGLSQTLILLVVGGLVLAGILVALNAIGDDDKPKPAPHSTSAPPPTHKPKPKFSAWKGRLPRALAVKIDNSPPARPQTGLSSADVVVVEPVEGGLTRIMALYWSHRPSVIGPVRSARETDIGFLKQISDPVLAYSGSSPKLKSALAHADLVRADPSKQHDAFHRTGRKAPHNQYVNPHKLPATKRRRSPIISSAKPPSGGTRTSQRHVAYQAANFDFRWSSRAHKWKVSVDGKRMTSTDSGRVTADTVIVQHVKDIKGLGIKDVAGSRSPVAKTTGSGSATVLRGGKAYRTTWSRRHAKRPTVYRTASGHRMPLTGKVWIMLQPS